VTRTVHGLKTEMLLLNVKSEHILLVVIPVTRGLPELGVVHVGGDNLLVATLSVLLS